MPESGGANIEVAHHLSEQKAPSEGRGGAILEIAEAIVLAIVAVATAWSGYQAALWSGRQSELYGKSSKIRIQAEGVAAAANQERLFNALNVTEWLKAEAHGEKKLAELFQRRFLPEFRPVFEAWKKTDPLNNPDAPSGPQWMKEYHSAMTEEAANLNNQAADVFEEGNMARHYSDDYVRVSVTLATVLLLTAISQRFSRYRVRVGLIILAAVILCVPIYRVIILPRL
jgi:hypothetical protein